MTRIRRLGVTGTCALAGLLLMIVGFALTLLESQVRMDAATAAVALTPQQIHQLRNVGVEDVGQDTYRDWLIVASMTSGGRVPELFLVVGEDEDSGSWSWGPAESFSAGSLGGWQAKPLTVVTAAGLALVLGSLFCGAARWHPRRARAGT